MANEQDEKLDGLFLLDALSIRMKELDVHAALSSAISYKGKSQKQGNNNNNNTNSSSGNANKNNNSNSNNLSSSSGSSSSAFHKMMLAKDAESGYTSLHRAILTRDLLTLLMLLKHASSPSSSSDGLSNTSNGNTNSQQFQQMQMLHPLRLLDGNLSAVESTSFGNASGYNNDDDDDDEDSYRVMNDLAASVDAERLTPLQLLGSTSASGLEHCRRSLLRRSLRKTWKLQGASNTSNNGRADNGDDDDDTRRYYRRRMISFGDDRDYDPLHYEMEEDDDPGGRALERERRARSGSFNVNLNLDVDEDGHQEDEEHEDHDAEGAANDLMPLGDNADFGVLANGDETYNNNDVNGANETDIRGSRQQQRQRANSINNKKQPHHHASNFDEYGCEVLTFGRAGHAALGVPQFTTSSGRMRDHHHGGGKSSSTTSSYKPKRVETFALGELRRQWSAVSSSENDSTATRQSKRDKRETVDSPAAAIAASTHHTLVSTTSGRLYSFGLGKGGRLGTGDETHRPLPTRVLGPLARRIVAGIAAAENHSLCCTSEGDVFAWGSNGFGQLGIPSSTSSSNSGGGIENGNNNNNNSRLSPRRVEGELKQAFVVAVAAGDRHSVALTKAGEVYCWGDNRSGQLGMFNSSAVGMGASGNRPLGASSSSSSSQSNGRCSHRPQRVESLWSAQPRRRAIAISGAEFSTLVLTMPPTMFSGVISGSAVTSLPVNTIYGWGHGNHSPMRVMFPTDSGSDGFSSTMQGNSNDSNNANVYARSSCINPTAIACAKYHNVAITADGRVYTWGLHSESLGIEKASPAERRKNYQSDWSVSEGKQQRPRSNSNSATTSSSSSSISSPQLVADMLPENGGGKAVSVSASESHTAVVTSDGHLYTWGTSHGNSVLGHRGVRWQPSPRKVKGVHRAVGVAVAKEHTVLLMGTSFPPLPGHHNNIQAEDDYGCFRALSLQESAAVAISRNVDMFNVIPIALVAHRLNCRPLMTYCESFIRKNLDGVLAVGNKNDFTTFLSSQTLVGTRSNDCGGSFHPFLFKLANSGRNWVNSGRRLLNGYVGSIMPPTKNRKARRSKQEDSKSSSNSLICSAKIGIKNTTGGRYHIGGEMDACDQIETPSNRKKSHEIPMVEKSVRPPDQVPTKFFQDQPISPKKASSDNIAKSPNSKASSSDLSKYRCFVCGVSCPDSDSYTLHVNGRKHRNRLMHAKADEEKSVAESMMAMKRMQLMETSNANLLTMEENTPKSASAWGTPKAPKVRETKKPISAKKVRSKLFQDILKEEQKRPLPITPVNSQVKFPTPILTKTPSFIIPKSPPPVAAYSLKKSSQTTASPGSSLPLSAFMKKKNGDKLKSDAVTSVGASWGANNSGNKKTPASARKTIPLQKPMQPTPPSKSMKSFSQIQQDEEAFRIKEDHMCRIHGNEWFVQQRERAASIGEIQEKEKCDREMEALIEEQRQIELEIMKRVKQEQEEEKNGSNKKNKEHGRRKQPQQQERRKKKSPKKSGTNAKPNKDSNLKGKSGTGKPKKNPTPDCKK